MKKWNLKHKDAFQIIISLIAVLVAGYDMIGKPARLSMLLVLVFGSIAIGASIGVLAERRRSKRKNKKEEAT